MTTKPMGGYQRSPLRSLYNYQGAMSAAERANMARMQSQLGGLAGSQTAKVPSITDSEREAIQKKAAQYGVKSLTSGSSATNADVVGGTAGAGSSATVSPIDFNDSGITTTTYDGSGAQVGETTTSAGTGEGGGDSGGSYLGAVAGALAGYGMGDYNNETDPNMRSGKDGFGKHNTTGFNKDYNGSYDNRAAWGGGVLGGVMGYFSDGYATPLVAPVVRWVHPYAEKGTRGMINFGDKLGGAGGAFMFDPIGAAASGKYSKKEMAMSPLKNAAMVSNPGGQYLYEKLGGLSGLKKKTKGLGKKIKKHFGF